MILYWTYWYLNIEHTSIELCEHCTCTILVQYVFVEVQPV